MEPNFQQGSASGPHKHAGIFTLIDTSIKSSSIHQLQKATGYFSGVGFVLANGSSQIWIFRDHEQSQFSSMGALKPTANMTAPHLAPFRFVFFQDAYFPFYCMLYSSCQEKSSCTNVGSVRLHSKEQARNRQCQKYQKGTAGRDETVEALPGTALFTQIPGWFTSLSRGIACIVRRALSLGRHHLIDYSNNYQPEKGRK